MPDVAEEPPEQILTPTRHFQNPVAHKPWSCPRTSRVDVATSSGIRLPKSMHAVRPQRMILDFSLTNFELRTIQSFVADVERTAVLAEIAREVLRVLMC